MPGYTHAPTLRGGKPIDPDQPLLHFEAFVEQVLDWVHHWNHENTPKSLNGQTPAKPGTPIPHSSTPSPPTTSTPTPSNATASP